VGSLIAVPDINSLLKAGERAEIHLRGETMRKGNIQQMDGVSGLKSLGVRELNYKLIFVA
jgi:DNA replication licensing factor MCM6